MVKMILVRHLVFISTTIIKFLPSIESLESNHTVSIRYLHLPSGSIFGKRSELDPYSTEQDNELVEDQNVSRENIFIESPDPFNELKEFEQERNIKRVDYPISGSIFGKRSEEGGYIEPYDNTLPLRINNQRTEEDDDSNSKRTIYPYSGSIYGKRSFKRNSHYPISGSPFSKRTSYYPISGSPFGKRTRANYPISESLFSKRNNDYYPVSGSPFGKRSDSSYQSERCNDVSQKRTYPISGSIFGKRTDSFYPYPKKNNYFPISGSPFGKRTRIDPQFNFNEKHLNRNYRYIYDDRELDMAHLESEPSNHLPNELLMQH